MPEGKRESDDRIFLIDLKRKLSNEEFLKVKEAFNEMQEKIKNSLDAELASSLLFKLSILDKAAKFSKAARLIDSAASLELAYDPALSLRLIEANPESAKEISKDKDELKNAVSTITKIVGRRRRMRNAIFKNRKKSSKNE